MLGPVDDIPEIRSDQRAAIFLERVAGDAFLGRGFAALDIGVAEQRFDRLLLLWRLIGLFRRMLGNHDFEARFGRLVGGEQGACGDVER